MKLFSRSSAEGPGRRRSLAGRLALSVGLLLPLAASFGVFAAVLGTSPASASIPGSELGGTQYYPVIPTRVADTRANSGYQGAGDTLTSGQILTFRVAGFPNDLVPPGATAVVLNITAVNPSAAGYLTAYAAGQPVPFASTVNFIAGQTIANEATITLGNNGVPGGSNDYVSILNYIGSTDVVVDIQGYYAPTGRGSVTPGSDYFPITYPNPVTGTLDNAPVRVLDTRLNSGQQGAGETLGPDQQLTFYPGTSSFVPGLNLVPVGATAVVLNVTEADATASSYLTAWATGFAQPLASDLNFLSTSGPVANRVIVPLNAVIGGLGPTVSIYNWAGSTDVVADLDGYFAPETYEPTLCTPTQQTITPGGVAVSGSVTLTYVTVPSTEAITVGYNETDANIAAALLALTPIPFPLVSVTGGPLSSGNPIVIQQAGTTLLTLSGGSLVGLTGPLTPTLSLDSVVSSACPALFTGSVYYGLSAPARVADTRAGSNEPYTLSTLGSLSILDIYVPGDSWGPPPLTGGGYAPSSFTGIDANVTITTQNLTGAAPSFLTVFPAQAGLGLAQLEAYPSSDLNWTPGEIISNGDLVATIGSFPSISVDVFNWSGAVNVILDVYGYFAVDPSYGMP